MYTQVRKYYNGGDGRHMFIMMSSTSSRVRRHCSYCHATVVSAEQGVHQLLHTTAPWGLFIAITPLARTMEYYTPSAGCSARRAFEWNCCLAPVSCFQYGIVVSMYALALKRHRAFYESQPCLQDKQSLALWQLSAVDVLLAKGGESAMNPDLCISTLE